MRTSLRRADRECGQAVLETALAIPVLVGVTATLLLGIHAGMLTLQLTDRAHDYARALARGASAVEIERRARADVPQARVRVERAGDGVAVTLEQDIALPLPGDADAAMTITRTATAALEQQ